jgi:hypothetical protein
VRAKGWDEQTFFADPDKEVRLVLRPGCSVKARVVLTGGLPVASFTVKAEPLLCAWTRADGRAWLTTTPAPPFRLAATARSVPIAIAEVGSEAFEPDAPEIVLAAGAAATVEVEEEFE